MGIVWGNSLASHQQEKYEPKGVVGYADSSYAGDLKDRKSITRYCFFLG